MLASVSLLFDVEVGLLPKEEKLAVNIPLSLHKNETQMCYETKRHYYTGGN